jgi:hypothetical protein
VELQFLAVLNERVELLLQRLFVLLDICILIQTGLNLGISVFPLLDLSETTLKNPVDAIVLDF